MLQGVDRINSSVENDFTKLLPIFKSSEPGTEAMASSYMNVAIEKSIELINVHSITVKPKRRRIRSNADRRLASKDEYNNWVDDSYILMGKAYYYQKNYSSAIKNFTYVIRNFEEEKTVYEAYVWLIRTYTDAGRYLDALEMIETVDASEGFPSKLDDDFSLAVADYYIQQNQYDEAIPYLRAAIDKTHRRKDKIRYTYILAQLYQETEQDELAMQTFRDVIKRNPDYEMAFNARINETESFSGNQDPEDLIKDLQKMLNDDKNVEFQDQIYYAFGNIYLKEGNKTLAIDNYRKSVAKSVSNDFQRALSSLTLADIYFADGDYLGAQSYYDSAMLVIDYNYPRYDEIEKSYTSLTNLTDNLYTVEREDSLQHLGLMDEGERDALIDKWISERQAELNRQQESQSGTGGYYNYQNQRLNQQNQSSGWYFYNNSMINYGKTQFEQLWGERRLEDDWRRSNKSSSNFEMDDLDGEETSEESTSEEVVETQTDDFLSREYYTQNIPFTDEEMRESHQKIRDALYNAGRIFEEDFDDYDNAIMRYVDLLERYENSSYHLIACFELWDLYQKIGNTERSNYYRNLIINDYPESKYAKYLINPNYFIELEAFNDSLNNLYQESFNLYQKGKYVDAGMIAKQVINMEPDSLLLPKAAFIKTIGDGAQSDLETFGAQLQSYISTYPESATTPLAEDIYELIQDSTLVNYQQLVAMGYLNDEIQNEEVFLEEQAENDEFGGKFSYDEELLHYFVISYPRSADIDINRLKFDIANYNIDHYTRIDFDVETENLNSRTGLLVIRSLADKEQALIYFRSIIRKREVFQTLEGIDYANFVVSSYNYREILADKSITDYLKFFVLNYSRFIGSDFPEDELPDPEELMEQAREEENRIEERGSYVVVKAETGVASFTRDSRASQNFVIAVQDASFNMQTVIDDFVEYNLSENEGLNLSVEQQSFGDYKLMVISPISTIDEAMTYFRNVITNRDLYEEFGERSYRNFIISDENLNTLVEDEDMNAYMDFFRDFYLGGGYLDAVSQPEESTSPEAPEEEVTPSQPVIDNVQEPEEPEIYNIDTSGIHSFVLILPADEVDIESVSNSILEFNSANYPDQNLQQEQLPFDEENIMFKVSSFDGKDSSMAYLRSIVQDDQVYDPLSALNYRNFALSETNYPILMERKDISEYLDYYRTYYLNR